MSDTPTNPEARTPRAGPITAAWQTGSLAWRWFTSESIPQMAAALVYRTIFSLVPLIVLGFLVLRLFQGDGKETLTQKLLTRLFEWSGLSQLNDLRIPAESGAAGAGNAGGSALTLQQWIEQLVANFSQISFGAIGIVSALTLIYAALSLLIEVETTFNRIYGSAAPRSWARRVAQYWLLVTLGPLLVSASFVVADQFTGTATDLLERGAGSTGVWLTGILGYASTTLISALLLLILYLTVPNTRVALRPAITGAVVAGLLLELAKWGFRLYLTHAGLKSVYGALAVLPLFLMWMYITWSVVLLGLRLAFVTQHGSHGMLIHLWRNAGLQRAGLLGAAWIDPAHSVTVMVEVARGFERGQPRSIEQIAQTIGLDTLLARRVLDLCVERGMLVRVVSHARADMLTLARPASQIPLREVLRAGQDLAGPLTGSARGSDVFVLKMRRAQLDAAGDASVADLVGEAQGHTRTVAATTTGGVS